MKKTFLTTLLSFIILSSLGATIVHAQATKSGGAGTQSGGTGTQSGSLPVVDVGKLNNPFSGGDTLDALLKTIINNIILPIGAVLAVLAFIYSGFLFVTAQGNETKISKAKNALLYTAIGTAVLLGSWAISEVLTNSVNQLLT